jgi:hypothetical protein
MFVIVKDWTVFQDKNKLNGAKYRENPRIHLSAGQ